MKSSTELSTGFKRQRFVLTRLGVLLVCGLALFVKAVLSDGVPETAYEVDLPALRAKAESGDPWAQVNLGAVYDHGLGGIAPDPDEAVTWYRRAAEAGIPQAQFNLAHCLAHGRGAPRDDAEAFVWMQRAAEQGLTEAEYLLGAMLAHGMGTAPDIARARQWLERAAAKNLSHARDMLDELDRQDTAK